MAQSFPGGSLGHLIALACIIWVLPLLTPPLDVTGGYSLGLRSGTLGSRLGPTLSSFVILASVPLL